MTFPAEVEYISKCCKIETKEGLALVREREIGEKNRMKYGDQKLIGICLQCGKQTEFIKTEKNIRQ